MIDPLPIHRARQITRRHFLNQSGALGIGSIALSNLLRGEAASAAVSSIDRTNPPTPHPSPPPPQAKPGLFLPTSRRPPPPRLVHHQPQPLKPKQEKPPHFQ